jgi:hypothetical protein
MIPDIRAASPAFLPEDEPSNVTDLSITDLSSARSDESFYYLWTEKYSRQSPVLLFHPLLTTTVFGTEKNHSMKKVVFRIILAGVGGLMALGVAEMAIRVVYAADLKRGGTLREKLERSARTGLDGGKGKFNMTGLVRGSAYEDVVYELKPGVEGTFRDKRLVTNSRGLRDDEHSLDKPDGVYRIVGLGDSVTFGWGVEQEDSYMEVLEDRLNRLDDTRTFETFNFGVPGYNTTMEVATFEHRALKYNPDLVIILFVGNDLGVPMFMERPPRTLSTRNFYLWDFLKARVGRGRSGHAELIGYRLKDVNKEEKSKVLSRYRHMCGHSGYRRAMKRLADLTASRGIPVMIMQGQASASQQKLLADVAKEHGFGLFDLRLYTNAYVKKHGIPDTTSARQKLLWVSPGDSHPNAIGHSICADALIEEMRKLAIIEREDSP